MADNITLNAGSGGASLATDDVGGGVQVQRVKATFGVDGTYSDVSAANGLPITGQYYDATGSASAATTDIVSALDARPYRFWSAHLSGTFSATVRVQGSNDNTNWVDQVGWNVSGPNNSPSTTLSTGITVGQVYTKYLRLRTNTYTSGTVVGTLLLSANSVPTMSQYISAFGSAVSANLTSGPASPADGASNSSSVAVSMFPLLYNGATWDRERTPSIFKSVVIGFGSGTAGNTVWTPSSGKKFRLMRYKMSISNVGVLTTTTGGEVSMTFNDGAANPIPFVENCWVPGSAYTPSTLGGWTSGWVDLGNGYLSAVADRALLLNVSAALNSGGIRVNVCGTEE